MISTAWEQDILQVCRSGHVITDRLRTCAEAGRSHCDRCGATTLSSCPTCGQSLPGALVVPGLVPVGTGSAPAYCSSCGARFPWTAAAAAVEGDDPWPRLELLLRRLPRVIRQLRSRQGCRPPFAVLDRHDLEDLLRCVLPLSFEDVRPRLCTPRYADANYTDLFLAGEQVALSTRLVRRPLSPRELAEQLLEDHARWQKEECRLFVAFLYDPEGCLADPAALEAAWTQLDQQPPLRCLVASA